MALCLYHQNPKQFQEEEEFKQKCRLLAHFNYYYLHFLLPPPLLLPIKPFLFVLSPSPLRLYSATPTTLITVCNISIPFQNLDGISDPSAASRVISCFSRSLRFVLRLFRFVSFRAYLFTSIAVIWWRLVTNMWGWLFEIMFVILNWVSLEPVFIVRIDWINCFLCGGNCRRFKGKSSFGLRTLWRAFQPKGMKRVKHV